MFIHKYVLYEAIKIMCYCGKGTKLCSMHIVVFVVIARYMHIWSFFHRTNADKKVVLSFTKDVFIIGILTMSSLL